MASVTIDPQDFRRVLGRFPTGVTVVTANVDGSPIGVAIGSFVSISLDPPLVGFFLGKQSGSGDAIKAAGHFCVNVLAADHIELCGVMASRGDDKFEGVIHTPAPSTGAPVFDGVLATIDCSVHSVVELGDHNLIVGAVEHLEASDGAEPMVFFGGNYGTFGHND